MGARPLTTQATYGLYFLSSLLYLEPWHMLHSFVQYLFLLPSYVNILLIYAFCNLHDVSWGTKGDNGAAKDLGQVKTVKKAGEELAEVALPTRQEDVEALWQQARAEMRVPAKETREKRSPETKRSDEDRTFRTNFVLLFLSTNMLVILLFTSDVFTGWLAEKFSQATDTSFNPYLTAIFYAVLGLSASESQARGRGARPRRELQAARRGLRAASCGPQVARREARAASRKPRAAASRKPPAASRRPRRRRPPVSARGGLAPLVVPSSLIRRWEPGPIQLPVAPLPAAPLPVAYLPVAYLSWPRLAAAGAVVSPSPPRPACGARRDR